MLQLLPLLYPQVALCGFWVADDVTRWVSCVEYLPGSFVRFILCTNIS